MAASTLEEVLRHFGDPGRSQMILWLLILYNLFHVGMIQQFNIMISFQPDHKCKIPESNYSHLYNLTSSSLQLNELKSSLPEQTSSFNSTSTFHPDHLHYNESVAITNESIFALRPKGKAGKCFIYKDPRNPDAGQEACSHGWEYDMPYDEIYPVNEFDLVCDNAHLLALALSMTFVGVMVGGLIFGPVSDYFGRRVTMAMLTTVLSILSISIYFAPNYGSFVVVRVLLGILNQGLQTVCLTYVSELFLPRMRTLTSAAIGIMWALMLPLLAMLFFTLGNWRHVHLLMGFGSLISATYVWFLPESVVWLLNRGKVLEAAAILKKFAHFNHILAPVTLVDDLNEIARILRKRAAENAAKANISGIFRSWALCRITISLLYVWFTTSCVVFGLSFSISKLSGDMYLNYSITGFLEVILRGIILWFFMRFGRIKIITPLLTTCGILTIAGALLKNYVLTSNSSLDTLAITALALLARNLIAVNFTLTVIFTSELFPTVLRSTGIGLGFSAARLGNVLTPMIYFGVANIWVPGPQIIYGVMALLAGLIVLSLPETFNRPMPNSVEDVENMMSKKKEQQKISTLYNSPAIFNEQRLAAEIPVDNGITDDKKEPNIIYKSVKEFAGNLNK